MNTTYRRLREEKGFTLVELLIVIVILGVLSGIVVFAVGAFNNEGVAQACASDAKAVQVAQEAYKAKTGSYATTFGQLTATPNQYLRAAPSGGTDYSVDVNGVCTVTP